MLEQRIRKEIYSLEQQDKSNKRSLLRQPARVTMTTLEDIEKAVAELPADQLARFRAWFEEFEAARFDQKIERDAKAGRLDQLAEQALADFRAGRAREL